MKKIGDFFKKAFSTENLLKFFRSFIWLMVLMFIIDIFTKWAVLKHYGIINMENGVRSDSAIVITIIKNFCYIGGSLNKGMAFSFLDGDDGKRVLLLIISLVMTGAFIAYYVIEYKKLDTLTKVGLALMISGAFGNLIDRAFYWESITGFGGVIDWIIFKFGRWEFAMFNIADACLVVGIIIIMLKMVLDEIKAAKEKAKRGEFKYSPEELEKMNKEQENNHEDEGNQGE